MSVNDSLELTFILRGVFPRYDVIGVIIQSPYLMGFFQPIEIGFLFLQNVRGNEVRRPQ